MTQEEHLDSVKKSNKNASSQTKRDGLSITTRNHRDLIVIPKQLITFANEILIWTRKR